MQLFFNNQLTEVENNCTLLQLLVKQNLSDKQGIAVAVNNHVVPRAQWPHFSLQHFQTIVVFTVAQGG